MGRKRNRNTASHHKGVFKGGNVVDQTLIDAQDGEVVAAGFPTVKEFPLLKLPAEVREMIYEHLISAGHLSILRVSKMIKQEATSLLSQCATARINLDNPNTSQVAIPLAARITFSGILTLTAPDYIQHVDLRIGIPISRFLFRNKGLVHCFSGNRVPRKSCKITFKPGTNNTGERLSGEDVNEIVRMVATLPGFMKLTLKFASEGVKSNLTHSMLLGHYQRICDALATRLGPAEFNRSFRGHCIVFRPMDFDGNVVKNSYAFWANAEHLS